MADSAEWLTVTEIVAESGRTLDDYTRDPG